MRKFTPLLVLILLALIPPLEISASGEGRLTIAGWVVDSQRSPIEGASIRVEGEGVSPQEVVSQGDGSFVLELSLSPEALSRARGGEITLILEVRKPGFESLSLSLRGEEITQAGDGLFLPVGKLSLERRLTAAFFIATLAFLLVLAFIIFRVLHETVAALLGAVVMLGVTYLLGSFNPDFWIISFPRAVYRIDFNVIFLIMGMMIFVAIMGQTGVFQWLAYQAYRLSGGNAWHLAVLLSLITAFASAFLNNVTIMLLVAPVTIEMALVLGVHPFIFLIPEVLAANLGGAATLIGDPPNILIGSYAGLGFSDFLIHMGPMVIISLVVLLVVVRLIYGKEYAQSHQAISLVLAERLRQDARITDREVLRKGLFVSFFVVLLFIVGEYFQMPASVVALLGATALLVWVKPDVEEMLHEVDWTTLVFFMALFIVVGGIQEVGFISMAATFIKGVAGESLIRAVILVVGVSAVLSALVANIPLTAAALPIAASLTAAIPGAQNNVLYWALAVGVCFGGNATTIASPPNMVTAGLADRAGYHLSFSHFLRVGVPATLATVLAALIWIVIRYLWIGF